MRNLRFILLFISIYLVYGGPTAWAQASAGIVYGVSVPDADNTTAHYIAGVSGSVMLGSSFSFGGYFFSSAGNQETGGRKYNYNLDGLRAVYQMGETYFGVMGGLTKVKTTQNSVDLIFSPYHYGIVSGHDFPLLSWLTIGFEGFFIKVEDSNTTVNAVKYHEDPFNVVGFHGAIKFRF